MGTKNKSKKEEILVVVGPTASGKTALSIKLAKEFHGEIISADSRQVYRGLDIGTEKISTEEMDGIPHHLIDCADVSTPYTAYDFKKDAEACIQDIRSRDHLPIIAGGTIFYINTLLGTQSIPHVPRDLALRNTLESKSIEELYHMLQKQDPARANTIDPKNKRRLVRALEIVHTVGEVPKTDQNSDAYDVFKIGLSISRDTLREQIFDRAREAVDRGLVDETERLLKDGVSRERLSEIGLEYRETLRYLDGEGTIDDLKRRCAEKTWQYAKRQLMWLKRDQDIHWFESGAYSDIREAVQSFLSNERVVR